MNLIELYDRLELPNSGESVFNAIPIPGHLNFKIAVNYEGNPTLLLAIRDSYKDLILKNFKLKYLQVQQDVECKISDQGKVIFQNFTVITFISGERILQEYFLRISETLIKTLNNNPTQQQVINSLNRFIEVFRALGDTPTKTVQGLWAELFLIDTSLAPKELLNYWHNMPEERFDFNSGIEKVEVKSNSNFERIHNFSSAQLNPPENTQALIASIFIRHHSNGQSIQQIVDSISNKIQHDFELIEKLNNIVCRTLGNSFEQSIKIKYDFNVAKESLRFYRHQDIGKIDKSFIPQEVTEVKFKSDLSNIETTELNKIKKQTLFNSL